MPITTYRISCIHTRRPTGYPQLTVASIHMTIHALGELSRHMFGHITYLQDLKQWCEMSPKPIKSYHSNHPSGWVWWSTSVTPCSQLIWPVHSEIPHPLVLADAGTDLICAGGMGPISKWVNDHVFFCILKDYITHYNVFRAGWAADIARN